MSGVWMVASEKMRRVARVALRTVAVLYLCGLWLDAVGCSAPSRVLPNAIDYFMQVAALFPEVAGGAIDYRAEGWVCADERWQEMDTRPYFPLDADSKENRFQRALNFYREDTVVHRALDDYLVARHDAAVADDGIPRDRPIGGVRFIRVRIPIPPPGAPEKPFSRPPLDSIPKADQELLYRSPHSRIAQRCGAGAAEPTEHE